MENENEQKNTGRILVQFETHNHDSLGQVLATCDDSRTLSEWRALLRVTLLGVLGATRRETRENIKMRLAGVTGVKVA